MVLCSLYHVLSGSGASLPFIFAADRGDKKNGLALCSALFCLHLDHNLYNQLIISSQNRARWWTEISLLLHLKEQPTERLGSFRSLKSSLSVASLEFIFLVSYSFAKPCGIELKLQKPNDYEKRFQLFVITIWYEIVSSPIICVFNHRALKTITWHMHYTLIHNCVIQIPSKSARIRIPQPAYTWVERISLCLFRWIESWINIEVYIAGRRGGRTNIFRKIWTRNHFQTFFFSL